MPRTRGLIGSAWIACASRRKIYVDRELDAARNILTTDTQRDQFDRNVAQIHEDEAKREEEMQQQMSNFGQHGGTR